MLNLARNTSHRNNPPLPGTLTAVLTDFDQENDPITQLSLNSPIGTPRPPPLPTKDDNNVIPPPPMSLPEQVDDFGWTLVAAIRDFRTNVEDVFADHYQAMKRAEDVHKMTLAKMAAENGQLRERLGLNTAPAPTPLFQNIYFQEQVPPEKAGKKLKSAEDKVMEEMGLKGKDKPTNKKGGGDDKGMRPMVNVGGQALDPTAGGGCWETFVCWVPMGAALQAPQPWKPLPNEAFTAVDTQPLIIEDDDDGKKWQVLECFEADKEELAAMRSQVEMFRSVVQKAGSSAAVLMQEAEDDVELIPTGPPPLWFLIHPHSRPRISWDMGSLVLVLYDMVMIPMSLAFDLTDGTFIEVMSWTTRLFWTFDMGMSVCTGIVMPNGTITFDFKFIVKRYLKTWFVLDVFIVASDWIEVIMSAGGGGGGFGRLARIFRIVRSVRLLRLVRMQSVMQTITERIQSDYLVFILKVVKMIVFVVSFSHIIACVWWGIGKRSGPTWAKLWLEDEVPAQYLVSLHWTLSQFSGGMDEVRPAAAIERFFAVMLWIIAFTSGAIVVSVLTSSLVQAHIIGGSQARQLATLRKYLVQNSISKNLSLRVQRSAKHAISGDLSPDAVDLLGVVSEQLRLEMHFEMYSELFRSHRFFDQCVEVCAQVMRRICHQATSTLLLDAGDVLFSKGEAPAEPKMYFFFKGTLEYIHPTGETQVLTEKQWIAEPVLWLQWVHRGQLKAISDIKIAKLDARRFQDIMERFKEVFPPGFNPKVYAHDYAQHLNEMPNPEQVSDLTGVYQP